MSSNGNGHALTNGHTNGNGHSNGNGHTTAAIAEPPHYAMLREKIAILKQERNAIILAHNYQEGAIQDIADFTGDSLGLARKAQGTDAKVIVFCGVHFMAETAAMLCPDKTVLIPDLNAGCSLADMIIPGQIRSWRQKYPEGLVVCYVNT